MCVHSVDVDTSVYMTSMIPILFFSSTKVLFLKREKKPLHYKLRLR